MYSNWSINRNTSFLTLSHTTNFRLFQTERVCRWQIWWIWQKVLQMDRQHYGKRRNCSLRRISPFPTVFSKDLLVQTRKNQGLFGKGLTFITLGINKVSCRQHRPMSGCVECAILNCISSMQMLDQAYMIKFFLCQANQKFLLIQKFRLNMDSSEMAILLCSLHTISRFNGLEGKDFWKQCGNRRCWLPAFSPHPTMFSNLSKANSVIWVISVSNLSIVNPSIWTTEILWCWKGLIFSIFVLFLFS